MFKRYDLNIKNEIMKIIIESQKNKEIIDITNKVESFLKLYNIKKGVCIIFAIHTTCALTCADLDPGTDLDFLDAFEKIIPRIKYRHTHDPKHVGDHILSSVIGPSVAVFVENGKLVLGSWQRLVLIELSGPRKRTLYVRIVSDKLERQKHVKN